MTTTAKELYDATLRGESILARHARDNPDMPVFLLIAQDNLAAEIVGKWVALASVMVPSIDFQSISAKKVAEAKQISDAMAAWPIHQNPV